MGKISIRELAEGAQINFENVVKMNPALGKHPIFAIAMEQLKEVIKLLAEQALSGGK